MGVGEHTEATALSIDCPNGSEINLTKVAINTGNPMFATGIIPNNAEVNDYCLNTFEDANQCSSKLDQVAI